MYVNNDVFAVSSGENFIIWSPLTSTALEVNGGVINLLQSCQKTNVFPEGDIKDELLKAGILSEKIESRRTLYNPYQDSNFKPTTVTLFTTSDCELRCTYCYAAAGEKKYYMEWEMAKSAIDLLIVNAKEKKQEEVGITFHGGGEPLYGKSFQLIRQIAEYARKVMPKNNLNYYLAAATNGILSKQQLEWVMANFRRLTISIDGPKEIQDKQRPLKNGQGSFNLVMKTIKRMEEANFPYGIRVTVTKDSCPQLMDIVKFLHTNTSLQSFHIEPLFECGRCETSNTLAPEPSEFAAEMIKALAYARENNFEIFYSGGRLDKVTEHFCGATGSSFCVTPQGDVSSCYEVNKDDDPRKDVFFFGRYNPDNGEYEFDEEKLKFLRTRNVNNIEHCQSCFLKFNCAGDCPAKVALSGDMFDASKNTRCSINQSIGVDALEHSLHD